MLDLKKLLELLLKNEVEFVLIGGFAAVVHGSSSLTQDLDVCFVFNPENIRRLLKALGEIHPLVRAGKGMIPLGDDVERLSQYQNLYIHTDLGMLDLLGKVSELGDYQDVARHAVSIELFGFPCPVLDIESLIKSKEGIGRPKDKEVILQLKVIQEKLQKGE